MKKAIMVILIVLITTKAMALTIKADEVKTVNQILIYCVKIQNSRALFQITLPDMTVEKFAMNAGERRQFEINNRTYFFDLIRLNAGSASLSISEKK